MSELNAATLDLFATFFLRSVMAFAGFCLVLSWGVHGIWSLSFTVARKLKAVAAVLNPLFEVAMSSRQRKFLVVWFVGVFVGLLIGFGIGSQPPPLAREIELLEWELSGHLREIKELEARVRELLGHEVQKVSETE